MDVLAHYSRDEVKREIWEFSRSRWVALHVKEGGALIRYQGQKPLTISTPDDVVELVRRYSARTIYCTANLYQRLEVREDVYDATNVWACTPTWDIDNRVEDWRATLAAVEAISSFLEKLGVARSVYAKWSGEGCHLHIHHLAVSSEVRRKYGALDVAYAIVEYVLGKLRAELEEIAAKHDALELRVDNEMDPQRLFTAPLSLHRKLNAACVCFDPDEASSFDLSWTSPSRFRHRSLWNRFVEGEADELAEKAIEVVGPYPWRKRRAHRKHPPLDKQIMRWISGDAQRDS